MHFDLTGEGKKDEFDFHSWNPRQDRLFLRVLYPASSNKSGENQTTLELVDLRRQLVLDSFAASLDEVAWSSDGKWLMIARGHSLVFHPVRPVE